MRPQPDPADEAARLDDLRRRLYRPEATAADVRRYEAERAAPPSAPDEPVAPPRAPRRLGRGALLAGLFGAAVLVAVAALARPGEGTPPAPSSPALTAPQDFGDGEVLDTARGAVTASAAVTTAVRSTPVLGRRFEGRGNAVVAVEPPLGDAGEGGRAIVSLTAQASTRVEWRALLRIERLDRSSFRVVMARGRAQQLDGTSRATEFVFATRAPNRVAVRAPADVRWALVYATVSGVAPAPR